MDSIKSIARDLLREYRRTHRLADDSPVMKALQVVDDKETRLVYDDRLTDNDRAILAEWGIVR